MRTNDRTAPEYNAELELNLQEAMAQRQRAADLFGAPDWEDDIEDLDDADD